MTEKLTKSKIPVFQLHIKSLEALYKSYMHFIQGGALFVPTNKVFTLRQKVGVQLKLLNEPIEYPVKGTIVWITPDSVNTRWKPGIGIQFNGDAGRVLHSKIEKLLIELMESGNPTNTL